VSRELEVDSMSLELIPSDQVLLCSDGLTGVVSDATIAEVLATADGAEAAVRQLVDLANEAGGPDNITVLLLRYEDPDATPSEPRHRTISITTRDDQTDGDWAGRLGSYGSIGRGGPPTATEEEPRHAGRILGRASAIVLALVVVVGLVAGGARFLLSQSYFVGLDGEQVVIYEGIDATIGPIELARVVERTELTVDDVPSWYRDSLQAGLTAADLNDARRIVANAPRRTETTDPAGESDDEPADDTSALPAQRGLP
jgi:PPM family protein phosphatase